MFTFNIVFAGGSSKKAIERARKCGLKVMGLLALIDRQEGGREVVEAMGLPFKALFTKEEIFEAYQEQGSKAHRRKGTKLRN